MNEPYIQFLGKKTTDMNIKILNDVSYEVAETSLLFENVPGRDSDLIFDLKKQEDIEKTFPVRLFKSHDKLLVNQFREVIAWLKSSKEYSQMRFSGYPDYYYKALFYKAMQAPDTSLNGMTFDLTFKCQPYVFRLDGDNERSVLSGGSIRNPELFSSYPILSFYKTTDLADSTIYINGKQFRIAKEAGIGIITIDSENGIAYKQGGVNVSKYCLMTNEKYSPIVLVPGKNEISYTNISDFKIIPRWRNQVL